MTREFSEPIKQHIIEQQNHKCLNCGSAGHLTVHHQIPKCHSGGSQETNGVGLCRGNGTNNCHDKADLLTIRYGVPFSRMAEEGIMPLMETLPRSATIFLRPRK